MLALVPPRAVVPDSSLGFMVDHVLATFGGPGSDLRLRRSRRRGRQGALLARRAPARAPAGADPLDRACARRPARLPRAHEPRSFRLAPGSASSRPAASRGGRGRSRARSCSTSARDAASALGRDAVVSEYGMTELTESGLHPRRSPAAIRPLRGAALDARARARSGARSRTLPTARPALLAIFDLANLGIAPFTC